LLRPEGAPNVPTVDFDDPPSPRAVVRGILGGATLLAAVALVALFLGSGRVEWRLATLVLVLWSAWSFVDSIFESLVEPLGRFLESALTGGSMPGDPSVTIDLETATLERLLAADPAVPAHRAILAGIRLAEIYRTHQHDAAKAAALLDRLAARYPEAPELKYVRSPGPLSPPGRPPAPSPPDLPDPPARG
jgi:hypothetical protein